VGVPNSRYELAKAVDKKLISYTSGILATSDSEILDCANTKITDIAHSILVNQFHPLFPDIRELGCAKPVKDIAKAE